MFRVVIPNMKRLYSVSNISIPKIETNIINKLQNEVNELQNEQEELKYEIKRLHLKQNELLERIVNKKYRFCILFLVCVVVCVIFTIRNSMQSYVLPPVFSYSIGRYSGFRHRILPYNTCKLELAWSVLLYVLLR